jgi:hypothetical protein
MNGRNDSRGGPEATKTDLIGRFAPFLAKQYSLSDWGRLTPIYPAGHPRFSPFIGRPREPRKLKQTFNSDIHCDSPILADIH